VSGVRTILVCGDPARGDDGAALAAVARLGLIRRPAVRVRVVGQLEPDDLVAALVEGPCVVVDAVRGVEPGRIVEMPLRDLADPGGPQPASSHALPIGTVIGLAEALGADVGRGAFVGIGGGRFELGGGLSAAVENGLDRAAATIERRIHAPEAARCA
jgi:hydrogenase maturation protease